MDRKCKIIQKDLLDIVYEEKQINDEIRMHLKNCEDCRDYLEALDGIREKFSILELSKESGDTSIISWAFTIAKHREEKEKKTVAFGAFLLASFCMMSAVIYFGIEGFGNIVFTIQGASLLLSPLIVPLMFIKRLRKESECYE